MNNPSTDPHYVAGLAGKHQQQNAALAKTLCQLWVESMNKKSPNAIQLTESDMRLGLQEAKWPGRAQIYKDLETGIKWYFDGAHTPESIRVCVDWMSEAHSEPRQP